MKVIITIVNNIKKNIMYIITIIIMNKMILWNLIDFVMKIIINIYKKNLVCK